MTPDLLEYVDGFNPYIYCNQNPWGRWDPLGLATLQSQMNKNPKLAAESMQYVASYTQEIAPIMDKASIGFTVMLAGGLSFEVATAKGTSALINKGKIEVVESASTAVNQLKKASEALNKSLDLAKEEVKNQLSNPESFMIRAIENRLTTEELMGVSAAGIGTGVLLSAIGANDETSAINGMDVPVVGQVLGVSFSAGHSGMETIKEKVEFKTEKKTSQEESNKQTSNKEKQ